MQRGCLLIVLLILVAPIVIAEEMNTPGLLFGPWDVVEANSEVCKVQISNQDTNGNNKHPDFHISGPIYLYHPGPCSDINSLSFSEPIVELSEHSYYRSAGGAQTAPENTFPAVYGAGDIKVRDEDWAPFGDGDDFSSRGFLETKALTHVSVPPDTDYKIHELTLCANRLQLDFTKWTASPDAPWTEFNRDGGYSVYQACSQIMPERSGGSLDIRLEDTSGEEQHGYQGWVHNSDPIATNLPIFCGDIKVEYDGQTAYYSNPSDHSNGNFVWSLGPSYEFQLNLDYDEENGVLSGITATVDRQGGGNMYATYKLTCVDPLTPEDNQVACEAAANNPLGGSDDPWKLDESDDTEKCCYSETSESAQITNGGVLYYCQERQTPNGPAYRWRELTASKCGTDDRGERLPTDPEGYCCHPENANVDKPHLWNFTGAAPQDANKMFCHDENEQGILRTSERENPYAYAENQWWECNTTMIGEDQGKYICTLVDEEFTWEACTAEPEEDMSYGDEVENKYCVPTERWSSNRYEPGACAEDQKLDGTCCWEGRYAAAVEENEQGQDELRACFNGKIFSQFRLPSPILEALVRGVIS